MDATDPKNWAGFLKPLHVQKKALNRYTKYGSRFSKNVPADPTHNMPIMQSGQGSSFLAYTM